MFTTLSPNIVSCHIAYVFKHYWKQTVIIDHLQAFKGYVFAPENTGVMPHRFWCKHVGNSPFEIDLSKIRLL